MAYLKETGEWVEGVYQIEEDDPVMGGADGVDNRPHKELAARTVFLKARIDNMEDAHGGILHLRKPNTVYAVGDIVGSPLLPSWSQLECITAGTTAATSLGVAVTAIGQKITDGTVEWVLRHKGEMHNVGDIWMFKGTFSSKSPVHAVTGLPMLDVKICDGTNGTVDMTNRFPMGTDTAAQFGTLGGANSKTLTVSHLPPHNHAASAYTDAQGAHQHYTTMRANGDTSRAEVHDVLKVGGGSNQYTNSAGAHGHNVTVSIGSMGGGAAFDVRPAFTMVAFVQKIY